MLSMTGSCADSSWGLFIARDRQTPTAEEAKADEAAHVQAGLAGVRGEA